MSIILVKTRAGNTFITYNRYTKTKQPHDGRGPEKNKQQSWNKENKYSIEAMPEMELIGRKLVVKPNQLTVTVKNYWNPPSHGSTTCGKKNQGLLQWDKAISYLMFCSKKATKIQ